jgi:hypothetical protein
MAAPKRKFDNLEMRLPDGDKFVLGMHQEFGGKTTLKLRLPGEWSVDQLFRGAKGATKSVLVISRAD